MSGTLSRTFPVARKAHRCGTCGGLIPAGTRYHRWVGTGDEWPGLATLRECGDCFDRYTRLLYLSPPNREAAEAWAAERHAAVSA